MDAAAGEVNPVLHKIGRVALANGVPVHHAHVVKVLADPRDQLVVGRGPTPRAINIEHHHRFAVGQLFQQGPKLFFAQITIGAQVDDRGIAQLRFFAQALHQLQAIAALATHLGLHMSSR